MNTNFEPARPDAAENLLGALLVFIRQYPRIAFANWPVEHIATYLNYLAAHHCLTWTGMPGPRGIEVTGLGLGWRMRAVHWLNPEFVRAPYKFAVPDPAGDAYFFDVVIGYPGAVPILAASLQWQMPDWRRLQYGAIRRGKLRVYGEAERLFAKLERL